MRSLVLLVLALAACEPPPKVGVGVGDTGAASGAPSIRVLFPPSGEPIPLGDDCRLSLLVVVDIENLELVDPAENPDPVQGQGHWHFETASNYQASAEPFLQTLPLEVAANTTQLFTVSLQDNGHQPLGTPGSMATLEIQVDPPEGGASCP